MARLPGFGCAISAVEPHPDPGQSACFACIRLHLRKTLLPALRAARSPPGTGVARHQGRGDLTRGALPPARWLFGGNSSLRLRRTPEPNPFRIFKIFAQRRGASSIKGLLYAKDTCIIGRLW
jgi:hypothetical protein